MNRDWAWCAEAVWLDELLNEKAKETSGKCELLQDL